MDRNQTLASLFETPHQALPDAHPTPGHFSYMS